MCGHCKKLHPEYEKVDVPGVSIYNVDASGDDAKALRSTYKVSGFPTILLFNNGKLKEKYETERTTEAITAFLKERTTKSEVQLVKDITAFLAQPVDTLFLLRAPELLPEFRAVAEQGSIGCVFGWMEEAIPNLLIRQNLEDAQITIDDMSHINSVFDRYRYPSVMLIDERFQKYGPPVLHTKASKLILFTNNTKAWWGMMRALADDFDREIAVPVLAHVDHSKNLITHFKLEGKAFPIALVDDENGKNSMLEGVTVEVAEKFFKRELSQHDEL
jgi:thiol-disulfide isomerase/thioredoxin